MSALLKTEKIRKKQFWILCIFNKIKTKYLHNLIKLNLNKQAKNKSIDSLSFVPYTLLLKSKYGIFL